MVYHFYVILLAQFQIIACVNYRGCYSLPFIYPDIEAEYTEHK